MAKYIKFIVDQEQFGIDILIVQEIILPLEFRVTGIPNAPEFLQGIINLRGMIVPLVDLRVKLQLPKAEIADRSRIIICKMDETKIIGVLVDALSNVIEIPKEKVEPMRSETTIISAKHIIGVYKEAEALVVLIDIKSVIYESEHEEAQTASAGDA